MSNYKKVSLTFFAHCSFFRARCLRNTDRDINKDRYPTLYYPELYLVDGGYKAFYEQFRVCPLPINVCEYIAFAYKAIYFGIH